MRFLGFRAQRQGPTAVLLAVAIVVMAASPAAAKKADGVVGFGSVDSGTFSVNAVASKKSSSASGPVVFHLVIGDLVGQATCVNVEGGLAVVSGTLGPGTTAVDPAQTPGFNLFVADGSITPIGIDLLQLELLGFIPPGCSPQFPISPAAVTAGDIVLTDGSKSK